MYNDCAIRGGDGDMNITQNELNNIVYLCLKYTFGAYVPRFMNPTNADIKHIMLDVFNNVTSERIIDAIICFVIDTTGFDADSDKKYRKYMEFIITKFMKQAFEVRNDLGEDSNDEDIITKH